MRNVTRSQARQLLSEFPMGDPLRGAPFGERTEPATIGIISAIGSGLGAVSSISGMFGGKKESAPPPVSKPTVMPEPDDEASRAAKRRALAGAAQRRGRQSTILSDDTSGDLLGA